MDKAVPIMRAMARQWGTEYNLDLGDGESIVNKLMTQHILRNG